MTTLDSPVQPAFFFDVRYLGGHISEMGQTGFTRIPGFLREETRTALLNELAEVDMQTAAAEIGPYKVKQDYRFKTDFAPESLFRQVGEGLSQQLNSAAYSMLSRRLAYNDFVVQQYEPTDLGISAHRDGKRYRDIISVLVLEGEGEFFRCDDRDGTNAVLIENEPGDLLLMQAPGYFGHEMRPFHYVGSITSRRTSFALRQNTHLE